MSTPQVRLLYESVPTLVPVTKGPYTDLSARM